MYVTSTLCTIRIVTIATERTVFVGKVTIFFSNDNTELEIVCKDISVANSL